MIVGLVSAGKSRILFLFRIKVKKYYALKEQETPYISVIVSLQVRYITAIC